MATVSVFGGKVVLMSGHARQKRYGDRAGSPKKAAKRARDWSVRGYAIPTGPYVLQQQLKAMKAMSGEEGKHDTYEDFMDAVLPSLRGTVMPAGVAEARKRARRESTAAKIRTVEEMLRA